MAGLVGAPLVAKNARAQGEAENAAPSLEVVLISAARLDPTLSKRITSWFDRDRIRVRVEIEPALAPGAIFRPTSDATLHAWIVFEPHRARLYFARHGGVTRSDSYLVRELELERGLDEIGAERLAEVLHLSALALLDGSMSTPRAELERSLGQPAASTPTSASAPEVSKTELALERELSRPSKIAAPPPSARIEVGLGYGLALHLGEGVWHGPRARVAWQRPEGAGVAVLVHAGLPATHALDRVEVRLHSLAFSAAGCYAHALARRWTLEFAAGPGVTWLRYSPVLTDPRVTLGPGGNEWRPTLTAGAAIAFGASRLRAALVVELELSLSHTRYELQTATGTRVVAEPSPLAPRFALEARY